VLTMRKALLALLLFCTLGLSTIAQSLSVAGDKISLPDGDVIGAALDPDAGVFIVQQSILSTENGGLVFRSHRVLTSWGINSRLQVIKREFPLRPVGSSTHPCGRVDVVSSLGRVYLCSSETHLDVLDTKTLHDIGVVGGGVDQNIYDFAIDEQRSKIFVLSLRSDMSVKLATYAMRDGSPLQEITLSQKPWSGAKLAVEPKTGQVAVADSQETGHRYVSNINLCESATALTCSPLGKVDPVSQMSFLGRDLLFATSDPANDKKDCIGSLDVSTRVISHAYCSPSTGVHFAVGVILKRYIVGFTGTTKTHAFLERNSSILSSFSVWRAENPKVEAVINDPTDYGASQYELRIAASKTTPMFLTYAWRSNALYLYTIKDGD
jgi:hypothetical protein